jgi:ATP-dependent DNA ligase
VTLPVEPPLAPMLGRRVDTLPEGDVVYEPKWDGFRCLAFRDGDGVDLRSRHDRPLARYFPEVVEALLAVADERFVLDGEIIVTSERGFDFEALLARVHPAASRVDRLSVETPAMFVAFDLIAHGDEDLRDRRFDERRPALEQLLPNTRPALMLTPASRDPADAEEWLTLEGAGIDGVMAKRADLPYRPGGRDMVKVKRERTADCVAAGFRVYADRPLLSSLMLGLYDDGGALHHFGVVQAFTNARRGELLAELSELAVPLAGHPWEHGILVGGGTTGRLAGAAGRWNPDEMPLDWVPIAPVRVVEVAYDQVDSNRLRHPARFRRWRPDRDPRSCTLDQLEGRLSATELAGISSPDG